jgi:peptidoglycan/LPS O-acetylase OafA/YrhL
MTSPPPKLTSSLDQTRSSHMPQLDALRALAVGAVAYHHWIPTTYHFGIPFGSGGVQLFFVLSGFLISSILLRCRKYGDPWFALRGFYARRSLRICPLFYSVVIAAYLINLRPMRQTVFWHLSYLSNFYFFLHHGWHGSISHFWSLAVEEQFYLFWPTVVLFAPNQRLLQSFLTLCVVGVLSIVLLPSLFPGELVAVLPTYNFWALGLGALLALRNASSKMLRILLACSVWSLVLFVMLTTISNCGVHFKWMEQLKYLSMVAAFVWLIDRASHGFKGWIGSCLTLPILVYLGRISYGLYILHPFADVPVEICRRLSGKSSFTLAQEVALKTCVTILGAIISWRLLEKPVNSLKTLFPYRRKSEPDTNPNQASI